MSIIVTNSVGTVVYETEMPESGIQHLTALIAESIDTTNQFYLFRFLDGDSDVVYSCLATKSTGNTVIPSDTVIFEGSFTVSEVKTFEIIELWYTEGDQISSVTLTATPVPYILNDEVRITHRIALFRNDHDPSTGSISRD